MSSSLFNEILPPPDNVEAGTMDEDTHTNEDTEEGPVLSENAVSRWSRARMRAARVGKGLSKGEEAQKISLSHWLENIDPRHRYGHNLHQYYDVLIASESKEPFFYWLDFGGGKEVNLEQCPRTDLQHQQEDHERRKVDLEWIFLITNFVLELPSAVFDQLSSVHKPQFAFLSMLMSFAALFICIVEIVYKGRKEKVTWQWKGTLPWLYYPSQSYKPFGSFKDIIGLVCAICQCVVTTINYIFCLRHAENPIKISIWPIIFAFGLLCSKFLGNQESRTIEQR